MSRSGSRKLTKGIHKTIASVLGFALAATLVIACGNNAALRARVAKDFACPEDQIATKDLDNWVEAVKGCGKSAAYVHHGDSWHSPIERATFDLSCSEGELTMRHLGGGRVGVSGCGKRAVYVPDMKPCYMGACASGWIMNNSTSPSAPSDAE